MENLSTFHSAYGRLLRKHNSTGNVEGRGQCTRDSQRDKVITARSPVGVGGLFENAFSNAPIGMALIDMDGRWMKVNNALCRITGHPERELKAKTLRSLPS